MRDKAQVRVCKIDHKRKGSFQRREIDLAGSCGNPGNGGNGEKHEFTNKIGGACTLSSQSLSLDIRVQK